MGLPKFDFDVDIWLEECVEECVATYGLTHRAHWALKQVANGEREHGAEFVRYMLDTFEDALMELSGGKLT